MGLLIILLAFYCLVPFWLSLTATPFLLVLFFGWIFEARWKYRLVALWFTYIGVYWLLMGSPP